MVGVDVEGCGGRRRRVEDRDRRVAEPDIFAGHRAAGGMFGDDVAETVPDIMCRAGRRAVAQHLDAQALEGVVGVGGAQAGADGQRGDAPGIVDGVVVGGGASDLAALGDDGRAALARNRRGIADRVAGVGDGFVGLVADRTLRGHLALLDAGA